MINQTDQQTHNTTLLEEIFITPSCELITDRFSENQASAAPCNGSNCASGTCKGFV